MIKIEFGTKKKQKQSKPKKKVEGAKMEFSKRMLIYDYCVALILLVILAIGLCINCICISITTNNLIQMGMDVSMVSSTAPFNLEIIGTILGIWIGQLAVSSGAYYMMSKSDHKIQLPIKLINDLPKDVKDSVDMTQIITSVLSYTDN